MITAGLAAAGMSARVFHVPLLALHPNYQLKGLVVRTPRALPPAWDGLHLYHHFDDLLADPEIELVVVNSPHHLHYEQTKAALTAGKHCLVEKPVCLHYAEVVDLITLANARGLSLTAFQNRRFDADFAAAQTAMAKLGNVVEAQLRFDRWRPIVDTSTWKEQQGEDAGVFWNLMPHLADQALQLFGVPGTVFALERVARQGGVAPDFVEVRLGYTGAEVNLHVSYLAHPDYAPRIAIIGQQGCFYSNGSDRQEELLVAGWYGKLLAETKQKPGFEAVIINQQGVIEKVILAQPAYTSIYDGIYNAITHTGPAIVSQAEMLDLARLLALCRESVVTSNVMAWR